MSSDSLHKQREEEQADAAAEDQLSAVNGDASDGSSGSTPLSSSLSHSRSLSASSPFLTPIKSSLLSSSSSALNGHSSAVSSSAAGKPPVARPAVVKLVQPMSIAIGQDWDPLLHPGQQNDGKEAADDDAMLTASGGSASSGGAASPAPRGSGSAATPRAPTLSASVSSSELSSLASSVPSPSSSAPTPTFLSPAPSAPITPSVASPSSFASFSAPSPLTTSTSSSSLSSWLSSFSSSSSSRDVALISTPPLLFPDYIAELSALLYTLTVFPLPSPPAVIAQLQEALAASPLVLATPPASAVSAALSDLDARRKQLHQYNGSSVKKRQARLQRLIALHDAYVVDLKHLIVRARKKCDAGYEGLSAIVERLRSCFLMNEFNLLQEGMHLQDELYDNYEDMCKACILALRDRTADLQAVVDALQSASPASAPALTEHHFLSSKQVCLLVPSLLSMLHRAQDLSQRLSQVKVEYVQVSKVTEEEEKVGRHERIARVIDDFYASYNGDLTADYSPARSLEYEFSRFCLDERSREGQRLKRWMDGIQQQAEQQSRDRGGAAAAGGKERLTHHSILVFMRKFESNFAKEYGVSQRHRLYLRLLIQRMLFPRIWTVCCLLEDADGESKAQDEQFVSQADWLRCLRLEQLGVTAPFLMPDSVKQQVMEKISAGSSRWSKVREGGKAKAEVEEGVGGGKLPTELPTALKALLHLAEGETEGEEAGDAIAGEGKVEDADEFDRLFAKGGGGVGGGGQSAPSAGSRELLDKSGSKAESSPSVSPSPSFSSPLAASTSSSLSLSASAPLAASFTPPPPLSPLPVSPSVSSTSNSAQPAPQASSHSGSSSSSSSSLSCSSSASSAPLPARIAALKSRSSPLPGRLRPYLSCIECMEDISHLTSPLDMLQCLLAVARNIYKSATEYSALNAQAAGAGGKKAELGADSFFPIWLFVLIHSDVRDLHRRVRMMKEYGLVKTQELAEHEYYLTCMEGGLLFVRQADPDKY